MLAAARASARAAPSILRSSSRSGWRAHLSASRALARENSSLSGKYAEDMFAKWQADPASVHPSWSVLFQNGNRPAGSGLVAATGQGEAGRNLVHLVRAYQVRGHEQANLDPLGLQVKPDLGEMDFTSYGFTKADLDKPMGLSDLSSVTGVLYDANETTTLREIVNTLKSVYCGPIGYEYMHIPDREQCNWLRSKIEMDKPARNKEWRKTVLERLTFAERFEVFLANKWNTTKRFGIEGVESMTPGLKAAIDRATELGVADIVMGMPHRGRLNVLCNVIRKPTEQIFKEFAGTNVPTSEEDWTGSGDVKYHLGTSFDRRYPDGRQVHLAMMANPSHLEAVNPLVVGKAKAKMHALNDIAGDKVMPIIIHGDAAFAGQGMCYEQMQLSKLEHYHTGGTLHVIANNQVGFTTDPSSSRSTKYCSDLGKTFNAPIFHVNADHPEAVAEVFALAVEWRQKFHTDVIVDIIGYRKHGHNELDQPMFTQPMLYSVISKHKSPLTLHSERLVEEGVFTQAEIDECVDHVDSVLLGAYEASKTYEESASEQWLTTKWEGVHTPKHFSKVKKTGEDIAVLRKVGKALTTFPENFTVHRQIKKIYQTKEEAITKEANIDWGTAEALAFGSLLQQGVHVRLSGEDVERGTFSHRHAVVHDQKSGERYTPLSNVPDNKSTITVCNSPLSEYGVLGFDLGYSLEDPNQLVLWEAQFGDFVNGAQIIIDQFLSCGEFKWLRQSGLVMLLPHGYDGMGPDHSSCRIERFLQQCNEDPDEVPAMEEEVRTQIQKTNWQIVNCTTPANYFHVLRRQVMRNFRKPLVVVAPKGMLKMRDCQSTMADMAVGSQFQRLFPEAKPEDLDAPEKIRRVIFCSGKVYYELLSHRKAKGVTDVAIARIEQIQPFPFDKVAQVVKSYPNAEVVYMQEEPKNMGCWTFVQDRILTACKKLLGKAVFPAYIGRPTMASTAEGYGSVHVKQQNALIDLAICSSEVTKGYSWTENE